MYSPWPSFCFYPCPTQEFPDRVRHEGRTEEEAPPSPLGLPVPWWSGQHQAGILVHFLPRPLHTTEFHSQSSSWDSGGTIFSSPLRSSFHSTEALSSLSFSLLLAFKALVSQPWLPVCPWCCHCVLWVQDSTFSLSPLSSKPLPIICSAKILMLSASGCVQGPAMWPLLSILCCVLGSHSRDR